MREVVSQAVSEGSAEVASWAETAGAPVPAPGPSAVSDIWRPSHVEPEMLVMVGPDGVVRGLAEEYERIVGEAHRRLLDGMDEKGVIDRACGEMGAVVVRRDGRNYDPRGYVENRVTGEWARAMQDLRDEAGRRAGMDAVEVSAHLTCAEDHLPYQGRIYTVPEMAQIQAALDRPIAQGYNCRHILLPCWSDSTPTWGRDELAEMARSSMEVVEVRGRPMTRYDATQWQRGKEREVRREKLRAMEAKAAGADPSAHESRARELSREYRAGSAEAGLEPDLRRLRVPTLA